MSINFDESIRAIYYASLNENSDWMLGINEEEEYWHIQYRFRYYHSDDPWDQEDKKNWYEIRVSKTDSLASVIETVNEMFKIIEETADGDCYKLLRGEGTHKQFFTEFEKLPFVHKREATEEERREMDMESPIES